MAKLILQLAVASGIFWGTAALEWGLGWRIGPSILGFLLVHLRWERVIFRKIFEREEGYQHPKLAAHLQRFRELDTIEP